MRREAGLREGAHCIGLLPPGSIGAPEQDAGDAAMSGLGEQLTEEDMEAILPTDSPARLLYGITALRKLLCPALRLR